MWVFRERGQLDASEKIERCNVSRPSEKSQGGGYKQRERDSFCSKSLSERFKDCEKQSLKTIFIYTTPPPIVEKLGYCMQFIAPTCLLQCSNQKQIF